MQLLFIGGGSRSQPAQAGAAEEGLGLHSTSADQVHSFVGEMDQGSKDCQSQRCHNLFMQVICSLDRQCKRLGGEQSAFCSCANQMCRLVQLSKTTEDVADFFQFLWTVTFCSLVGKISIVCALHSTGRRENWLHSGFDKLLWQIQ